MSHFFLPFRKISASSNLLMQRVSRWKQPSAKQIAAGRLFALTSKSETFCTRTWKIHWKTYLYSWYSPNHLFSFYEKTKQQRVSFRPMNRSTRRNGVRRIKLSDFGNTLGAIRYFFSPTSFAQLFQLILSSFLSSRTVIKKLLRKILKNSKVVFHQLEI